MARPRPESVQVVKQRRDAALKALVEGVPYIGFLGVGFERRGDELTAIMSFEEKLIGNPMLPALHGVWSVAPVAHAWPTGQSVHSDATFRVVALE